MQQHTEMSEAYDPISERRVSSEQTSNFRIRTSQLQQEMTMIQKATLIVDTVTNLLCKQITYGNLWIDDEQKQLPVERKASPMTRNQSIMSKLEEVDVEQHRKKMKTLMEANKRMRKKRSQRTSQFQNSIKNSQLTEKKLKQQQRQTQLHRRRSLIEGRLSSKAQMMAKIRQMSLQSNQRIKSVKSKKFLYEQKQEEFKVKFLLPKIQEEKKMLERRKDKMRSIDINEILQHEKSYQIKRKTNKVNRSMTSRFIQSQTVYNPPQYVPKSYLLYQAEESIKKQQEMLRIKQASINKQRVKQFVKNVSEINKLQKEISKSRQKSLQQNQKQSSPSKQQKKKKEKKKQLSKQELTNVGNQYFKALLKEIKVAKQKRKLKQLQKETLDKQKLELQKSQSEDLQIQIRSEEIRTVQKIQKIERNYKIRSKKIDSIFNDTTIDPLLKYEKLKHQVQNLDMVLKTKNLQSEDINVRTQATGSYMTAIKAKLKLLEISNTK